MPLSAGQTFLYPLKDGYREHLWIIATDPDESGFVAVVNITSLRGSKDQTIVIRRGEHPFVQWDSCVYYLMAEIKSESDIQAHFDCGEAQVRDSLTPALLEDVVAGFAASDFTRERVRNNVRASRENARNAKTGD